MLQAIVPTLLDLCCNDGMHVGLVIATWFDDSDCHARTTTSARLFAGVLVPKTDRTSPLHLAASKAAVGHSEPASGLVSLLAAQHALHAALQTPVTHLRALNPHVMSLFCPPAMGESQHGTLQASVGVPRQSAQMCYSSRDSAAACGARVGTSAFAFQGTNAHVVLRQPLPGAASPGTHTTAPSALMWRLGVQWVGPLNGALAQRAASAAIGEVNVQLLLRQPALAALLDHRVQVGRSPLDAPCLHGRSMEPPTKFC